MLILLRVFVIFYQRKITRLGGEPQQTAFFKLKEQLTATPVLVMYDPCNATIVSANASSYGLGAVLLQTQPDESCQPVVYASRALSSTEQCYAQTEKSLWW